MSIELVEVRYFQLYYCKNLFKRGKIRPDIFGNLNYFTKYNIIGDERPDNIAYKEYNDSNLDWVNSISK